ncbi:MAG TPA: hypothetical protein VGI10_12215 [Polyangiaceae bacterium]
MPAHCGLAGCAPTVVAGAPSRDLSAASSSVAAPSSSAATPLPLAPAGAVSATPPAPSSAPASAAPEPSLSELGQRLRAANYGTLADILAARVVQTRRKMKLTEDEARRVSQELLDELPTLSETRMLPLMPKTTIELVRSSRERGVSREEAERMATFLLDVRMALDMDNPAAFDENCSHVVGREWQDIDYRDEGMQWEKQRSIYVPKGVLHFKDVANLRQFFRVESQAPYFQKVYGVKGKAP